MQSHELPLCRMSVTLFIFFLVFILFPFKSQLNAMPSVESPQIHAPPNVLPPEELNFGELQSLLERDQLNKNKVEKNKILEKVNKYREKLEKERSFFPPKDVFWSNLYHLWIARQSGLLQWKQPIADLGIVNSFANFLKSLGISFRKIEMLLIFSLHPKHLSMPTPPKEYFFILSYPFLQRMDLTLQEINLLLLEELVRTDLKQPHQFIDHAMELHPKGKQISSAFLKPIDLSSTIISVKNKKNTNKKDVITSQALSEIVDAGMEVISQYLQHNGKDASMHKEATLEVKKIIGARADLLKAYRVMLEKKQQLILRYHKDYGDYAKTGAAPGLQLEWLGL